MDKNFAYGVYCNGECVSDEFKVGCFESYEEAEKWIKSLEAVQEHPGHEQDYTIKECELPENAWDDCYEWPFEDVERGYAIFFDTDMDLYVVQRIDCVGRFETDGDAALQALKDNYCKVIPLTDLPNDLLKRQIAENQKISAVVDCPENREKLGISIVFNTTDSELMDKNGQEVKVLRPLTKDEADLDDVGPMYRVKFPDGFETDVFGDELR